MVVLKLAGPRTEASGSEDALALDVDLFDRSGIEIRVRAQTSNWTNRVYEPDAARNHFREHRLKDYIVLSVHQRDLDRPTSKVTPEKLLQGQCRVDSTEAAPQDEDPCWSWAHRHLSASIILAGRYLLGSLLPGRCTQRAALRRPSSKRAATKNPYELHNVLWNHVVVSSMYDYLI